MLETEDEMLLYGQFLDTFYKEKEVNYKYQLLENEPVYNPKYDLFFCLLAGSVEKLANDYHLPVPAWTDKSQYYLNRIYYAYDTKIQISRNSLSR